MEENSSNSIYENCINFIECLESRCGFNGKIEDKTIDEISQPAKWNRNQFEALTPEECVYAAMNLTKYITYLSNALSRVKATLHWHEIELNRLLGTFMEAEFGGIYGGESRKVTAIMSRQETDDLYNKIKRTKTAMIRLEGMIEPLKLLRQDINDIKIMKLSRQKMERDL